MFVAVIPPEAALEDLEEFLAPRREAGPFRWTVPEQWHLTLAFMEDVPERAYDDLVARLERAARKRPPMSARVAGGGAFPHAGKAKVLYAAIDSDAVGLSRLATGARAAATKAGAAAAGGPFRAHLTLARMGRAVEATKWVRVLDAYGGPDWQIDEIALIASHLGEGPRRRPRHEVLETFTLGRVGSDPVPPAVPPRGR
jgi:2'-5' RNA ligase